VEVSYQGEGVTEKDIDGETHYFKEVEYFAWEKLDYVDRIKEAFQIT